MAEQRVTIEGSYNPATGTTTNSIPVSGTLTTTPSGTQDVNIVSPSPLVISQPISTYLGVDPSWTGVYFQAIVDTPGVVASNNFLSVFNPVGSGKIAIALGFICSVYALNSVATPSSLVAFRTSAHSGGTDITAPNVNRFLTSFVNPSAQVKITGPATTNTNGTNPMIGIPSVVGSGVQQAQTVAPSPGASFVFLPGEGIVFNTPSGDVDQRWDIQYIWAEKPL
jgi:hypothetical protein